jgi:hypothetical protein
LARWFVWRSSRVLHSGCNAEAWEPIAAASLFLRSPVNTTSHAARTVPPGALAQHAQRRRRIESQAHPVGRVPTLELDDGTILTESLLILPLRRRDSERSEAVAS